MVQQVESLQSNVGCPAFNLVVMFLGHAIKWPPAVAKFRECLDECLPKTPEDLVIILLKVIRFCDGQRWGRMLVDMNGQGRMWSSTGLSVHAVQLGLLVPEATMTNKARKRIGNDKVGSAKRKTGKAVGKCKVGSTAVKTGKAVGKCKPFVGSTAVRPKIRKHSANQRTAVTSAPQGKIPTPADFAGSSVQLGQKHERFTVVHFLDVAVELVEDCSPWPRRACIRI